MTRRMESVRRRPDAVHRCGGSPDRPGGVGSDGYTGNEHLTSGQSETLLPSDLNEC